SSPLCLSVSFVTSTLFFLYSPPALRARHSFPTRRSSDLVRRHSRPNAPRVASRSASSSGIAAAKSGRWNTTRWKNAPPSASSERSEEHTSELQSRENLVCRLLLEKKKKNIRGKDTRADAC